MLTTKNLFFWLACLLVLLISIGIEWYGRSCGFLLTPDSGHYLAAAKNFKENGTLLNADGTTYYAWPPLFPVVLSIFKDPQIGLGWINVTCKILIALLLLSIANSFFKDSFLKVIFLITVMVSVNLAMISIFVWSDLVFMTLTLLNAHIALRLEKYPSDFYWLLITGFLVCLQRDAGFFWACGISLWLFLDRSHNLKVRIWQSALCFFVCCSGLIIWRFYYAFFRQFDSFRDYSFFFHTVENLKPALIAYSKMLLPFNSMYAVAFGALFFVSLFYYPIVNPDRSIQLIAIVISIYTAGFIGLPLQLDPSDMDRYFSAVTPLVYLFILSAFQEKIHFISQARRVGIYFIVCVWLCYPVARTFKNIQAWHERSCSAKSIN